MAWKRNNKLVIIDRILDVRRYIYTLWGNLFEIVSDFGIGDFLFQKDSIFIDVARITKDFYNIYQTFFLSPNLSSNVMYGHCWIKNFKCWIKNCLQINFNFKDVWERLRDIFKCSKTTLQNQCNKEYNPL